MTPRTVLIASTNPGKLREVCAVLAGLPVRWTILSDHPPVEAPEETGATFEENAALKAMYYANRFGCWTLADDSGLEVDALGGAPGVYSARYAGEAGNDAANNAKLIEALADVPQAGRTARFRCALALADGARVIATASGVVEGVIIDRARGQNGFGYDPHFLVPEFGLTTAEMPPEQKNRISHRGRALRSLREEMERLIS